MFLKWKRKIADFSLPFQEHQVKQDLPYFAENLERFINHSDIFVENQYKPKISEM